jgi:uncharacterized membrane protein YsdA (DUF1294 family)
VDDLPLLALAFVAAASVISFVAYAIDKSAAYHDRRRIPEQRLHLLALAGGWPGALLAQKLLHHKSKKREFLNYFWLTVAVNCVLLALLFIASNLA